MDDEFNPITGAQIMMAVLAAAVGWSFLWGASTGIKVAFNLNSTETTRVADAKTASIGDSEAALPTQPSASLIAPPSIVPSPSPSPSVTVMIGGDVMLDRRVRMLAQVSGYDAQFTSISPLFKSADIAIVNLEGTITSNKSKTFIGGKTTTAMMFTFEPSTAAILAESGISAVSLANNHSDNFGAKGFAETEKWLDSAEVGHFGDPWNSEGTELVVTKNTIPIAFIGYHAFQKGFDTVVAAVKQLKAAGNFVIVMPHWGVEYSTIVPTDVHEKARALLAAGADAIIGSHPHVVMDHAWFGNVPVFYSLGNLVFDQYFQPEVMKGNIVALHISKNETGTHVSSVDVYETSTASRQTVTVSDGPVYSETAPK